APTVVCAMVTTASRLVIAAAAASTAVAVSLNARADAPFAEPPPGRERVAVAARAPDDEPPDYPVEAPTPSTLRLFVGPAGKLSGTGASPGLLAALELGRGPTGFRATGAWVDVGSERGLAEYTGELTIDFGGRSRIHPT